MKQRRNQSTRGEIGGPSQLARHAPRRQGLDARSLRRAASELQPLAGVSRFLLLELTNSGREVLQSFGVKPTAGHGRGGIAHQWCVKTIPESLGSRRHVRDRRGRLSRCEGGPQLQSWTQERRCRGRDVRRACPRERPERPRSRLQGCHLPARRSRCAPQSRSTAFNSIWRDADKRPTWRPPRSQIRSRGARSQSLRFTTPNQDQEPRLAKGGKSEAGDSSEGRR